VVECGYFPTPDLKVFFGGILEADLIYFSWGEFHLNGMEDCLFPLYQAINI